MLPDKFLWNENCKEKFINILNDSITKEKINNFLVTDFKEDDNRINLATAQLTKIINDVGEKSIPVVKFKANKRKSKFKEKQCSQY